MNRKLQADEVEHAKRSIEWARRCGHRANGIYYDEELSGPGGMDYTLLPAEGTSDRDIELAKQFLMETQDVVRLDVIFVPPELVADDERDKIIADGEKKIAKIRDVVNNGFNKVEGQALDSFSASAIIAVYDALGAENRTKYIKFSVFKMAEIAFKLINKQKQA